MDWIYWYARALLILIGGAFIVGEIRRIGWKRFLFNTSFVLLVLSPLIGRIFGWW